MEVEDVMFSQLLEVTFSKHLAKLWYYLDCSLVNRNYSSTVQSHFAPTPKHEWQKVTDILTELQPEIHNSVGILAFSYVVTRNLFSIVCTGTSSEFKIEKISVLQYRCFPP